MVFSKHIAQEFIATVDAKPLKPAEPKVVDLGPKKYKAKMKAVTPSGFDSTAEKRCMLGVSLGKPSAEFYGRLDAMLTWIAGNYDECVITAGDYIYRLTLQLQRGCNETTAMQEAALTYIEFQESCSTLLSHYVGMCKFTFRPLSDIVVQHPAQYEESLKQFEFMYADNIAFNSSVDEFSDMYLSRIELENTAETKAFSTKYLLEECAIFDVLGREGPTTLVYGGNVKSIVELCEGKYEDAPTGISGNLRFIEVAVRMGGNFARGGESKLVKFSKGISEKNNIISSLGHKGYKELKKYGFMKMIRPALDILKLKQKVNELTIIISGQAEELVVKPDGCLERVDFLGAGSVVGAGAFFKELDSTSPSTVNALDECLVLKITRKKFADLLIDNTDIAAMIQGLAAQSV